MKKYWKFFRASFQVAMQYRFDFFMWIIFSLVQICLYFFLWRAIFANQAVIHGFTLQGMITYIVLAAVAQGLQPVWHWGEIAHMVHTGDIIFELVKPYNLLTRFYFSEMGMRIFTVTLFGVPYFIVGVLILHIQGPASLLYLLLALVSLFLSTLISYGVWTFVGLTAFFLTRIWGVYTTFDGLTLFLTGMLVPLDFMPGWLRHILEALPFKDIIYTPISIYLGRIPLAKLPLVLGMQVFWAVALLGLISLYYRQGLKKIVIQGG